MAYCPLLCLMHGSSRQLDWSMREAQPRGPCCLHDRSPSMLTMYNRSRQKNFVTFSSAHHNASLSISLSISLSFLSLDLYLSVSLSLSPSLSQTSCPRDSITKEPFDPVWSTPSRSVKSAFNSSLTRECASPSSTSNQK